MAVVIESTLGDITVDLYLDQRPVTCLNFLKLCKMKYYNFNLFHTIRSGFIAQTGDPTGEGNGGASIWGALQGPDKRFFSAEKMPKIRHTTIGLISMVCTGDHMVGSQFFFTLGSDLDSLDGLHCVIGEVSEGHEVLRKLNEVICDESYRPYRDVRITHTVVLEDPFSDPPGFIVPSRSPSPNAERLKGGRIAPDEEIDDTKGKDNNEIQEMIEEKEAKARATILEIVGDIPDADIAPPENVLFVCKLNPVTTDDDLEIIFSRFGKIVSCEVIKDKQTGNSLQYAFIEFDNKKSCEDAYFKMDNVLIDDRRIHVDFSQSVSKIKWLGKGRGVKYLDQEQNNYSIHESKSQSSKSRGTSHNSHKRKDENSPRRSYKKPKKSTHEENQRSNSAKCDKRSKSKSRYKDDKKSNKDDNGSHHARKNKDYHENKKCDIPASVHEKRSSNNIQKYSKRSNSSSPRREEGLKRKKNDISPIITEGRNEVKNASKSAAPKTSKKESKTSKISSSSTKAEVNKPRNGDKTKVKKNVTTKSGEQQKPKSKNNHKNNTTNSTSKTVKKRKLKRRSSSSESCSSSSDSSSSEGSRKKSKNKSVKKRRRRSPSTSSSSSSDSSSSSTSSSSCTSDSSSYSSSSSSDYKKRPKKRHKGTSKKKSKK